MNLQLLIFAPSLLLLLFGAESLSCPTSPSLHRRSGEDFLSRGRYSPREPDDGKQRLSPEPRPPPTPNERGKQEPTDIGLNTDPTTGITLPDPFRSHYGQLWKDKLWGVVKVYAKLAPEALPASLPAAQTAGLFLWPIDVSLGLSGYLLHVVAHPKPHATTSEIPFDHRGLGRLDHWKNPRRAEYALKQTVLRTPVHLFDLFPDGLVSVRRAHLVGDVPTSSVIAFARLAMEERVGSRGAWDERAGAWVDDVVRSAKLQGFFRAGPTERLRTLWGEVEAFMEAGEEWNLRMEQESGGKA